MKLLVCGDRNWKDDLAVIREIALLDKAFGVELIVEGGAKGADTAARELCINDIGIPIVTFWAPWGALGKKAGPMRNGWMLKYINPDFVLAFHRNIKEAVGTANMVRQAKKAGIKVKIVKE